MRPHVASIARMALCMGLGSSCAGRLPSPEQACAGGIEATFIQLSQRELSNGVPEWTHELLRLQSIGIHGAVLQYSGDELGPFDGRVEGHAPVRALLEAASALDMSILVGLYRDPRWPDAFPIESGMPPPLDRPAEMMALLSACEASPACLGWYVPQEIDDFTWSSADQRLALRGFLDRTGIALRGLAPGRRVALAPFYTGASGPDAHALFWRELLADRPIDMLMLQDGVGSGHGSAEKAALMLGALRPTTDQMGIELWSTVELFRQLHGPPRDALPFEATPADLATVQHSVETEGATGARLVAFAALDYMNPDRGKDAAQLFEGYAAWCAARRAAAGR
jgi:hypothetical protein